MIRLFIGFDPREAVAYHTMVQSIIDNTSAPVAITPLALGHLDGRLTRARDPRQSTDFAFSRFLVPSLCGFEGWALFMDCDMIVLGDLADLWSERDPRYAVQVVKHDHRPREDTKFLGQAQTRYAKKNWSSVMLFNNTACRALTETFVNQASGLELHQFRWLDGEDRIGDLAPRWNHLVGYDAPDPGAAVLHYTTGGPYFDAYADVPCADLWQAYHRRATHAGSAPPEPAPSQCPSPAEGSRDH
ncbi:MAG: glycosyltransferase [Gammaproteobacteria bacterium]